MPHTLLVKCSSCGRTMEEPMESPHVNVGRIQKKGWGRIQIDVRGRKTMEWICPKCLADRVWNKTKP